jgi:hypothetical protein
MIDPKTLSLVELRMSKLRKEAEVYRLFAQTRAKQARLRDRFLLRVGNLMVDMGTRLRERCNPQLHEASWRQVNGKA